MKSVRDRCSGRSLLLVLLLAGALSAGETAPVEGEVATASMEASPVEVTIRGDTPVSGLDHTRDRDVFETGAHGSGSDLMQTVPGVFITQHSGEGKAHQIFFRGFDAVHGQDIEIEVAGVPVNDVSNIHGQGYADVHFVIPEVVQRIVALPLAFDASQGDFAVAGTLRYELGYPHDGLTAKMGIGSFGSRRVMLAFHPADASVETFGAAEVQKADGFGPARASERMSGLFQWRTPIGKELDARLLASTYASRFESAGVLRARDVESGLVDRYDSYDERQGGESSRSQLAFELGHFGEAWTFGGTTYLVLRSLRLQSNYTGALEHPLESDDTLQRNDAITFGVNTRVARRIEWGTRSGEIGVGVEARQDQIAQGQRYLDAETTVDADVSATQLGGYVTLGVVPSRRVLVRAALRADRLGLVVEDHQAGVQRESMGVHLAPRATVEVSLLPGLATFAGYGAGFRSPQARSVGDGERTPFTHVDSVEAGIRQRDGDRFSAQVAAFASALEDDLVFDEATSRNERVPSTERHGVAADVVTRVRGFVSACGGSYTRATFSASNERYAAGETLPFVPQWVVRCDLGVRGVLGRVIDRTLRFRLGSAFNALVDRPLPFGERGSDVFLVDALAGIGVGNVELTLDAQNLLDREWNDGEFFYASAFRGVSSSAIAQRHFTAGSPRALFATLTFRLGANESE